MTDAAPAASAEGTIVELVKVLQQLDRPDLVGRATAAVSRLRRPNTIVCVVGEFKQGKSSLVNALVGQPICPIDDDLATSAITLVRYADEASAVVRRRDGGEAAISEAVPIDHLADWVTEAGNPGNIKQVERLEVALPSPLLKQGLVLVDTPGMGGLGAGHAAATLGFLPFADGLIFVSDASTELSAPEVAFLRRATELCPTVLFAQTKIDLYPQWQRIHDLNRAHLDRLGLPVPMVAVSSAVRAAALTRKDRELNERSRFPVLVKELGDKVVAPAKAGAAARSTGDARSIAAMVRSGLESERAGLADPAAIKQSLAELDAAKAKLEQLRGPGARWSVLVGDRMADLSNTVSFDFRGAMRSISRNMDEVIEGLQKGDAWDDMVRDLQGDVADEVTNAFVALDEGRNAIRDEVIDLLGDEHLGGGLGSGAVGVFDAAELWQGKGLDNTSSSSRKKNFDTSMTGVKGAQGGIMMFGMMGQFLPKAAGALLATNPVMLGIGALFGGMGLVEDRRRKVTQRRQVARTQVRQFLDDVQFEVGNQISTLTREIQRELRDEFTDRLSELQRTYTDTAKRAQENAQRTQQERQTRTTEVDQLLGTLKKIEAALAVAR
jgi:dynamin family protein